MKVRDILAEDRYEDQWIKKQAAANRAKLKAAKADEKAVKTKPATVKKPVIDLFKVFDELQNVVSNVIPDGDPIDMLGPKLRRMGIDGYKIVDTLTAAVKKHYDKNSDYHQYLADMWDQYNDGIEPNERRANPWR